MRSAQVPIKVECFIIKERDFKEKIGYLLISIRSAQIVTKNRKMIKSSWNTLLGLKGDLKICKPELMLSLTVEDQDRENTQFKVRAKGKCFLSKNCKILFFNNFSNFLSDLIEGRFGYKFIILKKWHSALFVG